jgi:hypothetical protein
LDNKKRADRVKVKNYMNEEEITEGWQDRPEYDENGLPNE